MKHSATSSDRHDRHARASWPLPEPTLAYFPNARFVTLGQGPRCRGSPSDQAAEVSRWQTSRSPTIRPSFGHVPVLLGPLRRPAHPGADPAQPRRLGRSPGRRHPGRGRPCRAIPHRASRAAADRPRSRPDRAGHRRRTGWRGSPTGSRWCVPATTGSPTRWPNAVTRQQDPSTACCSTSASPRCSWTAPSAGSPTPRTRRWTCGWIPTRR